MDSWEFKVLGEKDEDLLNSLKLAFSISGSKARSWKFDRKKGFILLWSEDKGNAFPERLDAEDVYPLVKKFLNGENAKIMLEKYEEENQQDFSYFDGTIKKGWTVYTEQYGKIGDDSYAFLAIKPTHIWYGK